MRITRELLEKYQSGLCTAEQKQAIKSWLADGSKLGEFDKSILTQFEKSRADAEMRRFLALKTGAAMNPTAKTFDARRRKLLRYSFGGAAALIGFVVLLGVWSHQTSPDINSTTLKEIYIPYGSKKTVTLPDGTSIHLNAGSKLLYPEQFAGIREVTLTGEAFFKVAADPSHPFIINTNHDTKVKVLGTSFNVRAYDDQPQVDISVEKGIVDFMRASDFSQRLRLKAGESASYSELTQHLERYDSGYQKSEFAWINNQLVFNYEKLEQAVIKIERWFNVKINIENANLSSIKYTGTYDNPKLDVLLNTMGFVLGFKYKMDKTKKLITLY